MAVGGDDVARDGQQESQSLVGHVLNQHARRRGHRDAATGRTREVDRIDSHAKTTDNLQGGQLIEQRRAGADRAVGGDPADAPAVLGEQSGAVRRFPETVNHIGVVQCLHDAGHQRRCGKYFDLFHKIAFVLARSTNRNPRSTERLPDAERFSICAMRSSPARHPISRRGVAMELIAGVTSLAISRSLKPSIAICSGTLTERL